MRWLTEKDDGFYFGGLQEKNKFNSILIEKIKTSPNLTNNYKDIIDDINLKGYSVIPNVFSKEMIQKLNHDFDENYKNGNISSEDEHYVMLFDPLLISKTCFDIATSDIIFDISSEFYGCRPSLCTQNFRLSKINDLPAKTTQLFHADQNSIKFIKFFVYLNDVDNEGGPFIFVEGSNKKKFEDHLTKYRWEDKEIIKFYGEENIKFVTAKAGDLIVAQTTGFHKGSKPIKKERRMLTLNYVIHKEYGNTRNFKVKKDWVEALENENKKRMFEYMENIK